MNLSDKDRSPLMYVLFAVAALSLLMAARVLYQRPGTTASAKTDNRAHLQTGAPHCLPAGTHPMDELRLHAAHAHELTQQHRYGPAVTLYHEIAAADPAYPGVQLELSIALLDARQAEAANEAVNAQLAESTCLASLTSNQMETYCQAEMPGMRLSACQEQVLDLRRSAHLHAALVQMQLVHESGDGTAMADVPRSGADTDFRTSVSKAGAAVVTSPQKAVKMASAQTVAAPRGATPVAHSRSVTPGSRNPMASGDETDAALGAYSK